MRKRGKEEKINPFAVIYIRVSSSGQVEGTSLDTQREACIEYCKREDLKLDRIFAGEGESAKIIDRPELKELLDYCRKNRGKIGHLIVYKFDRFSRNVEDHLWLRKELIKLGITVKSVTEPTGDSLAGRLQENILAVFNEYDNALRAERCTKGMLEKIRRGSWPFRPPIGYMPAKKLGPKEKKLLPDVRDPESFHIVRKAFDLYLTGNYSISEVARRTNSLSAGKFRFYSQKMQHIFSNKYYCGILVSQQTGEEQRGLHEPMLTHEEFAKVQHIMSGKGVGFQAKKIINPDFPLRGAIRCGNCQNFYTGSWSRARNGQRHAYYHCFHKDCQGKAKYVPKTTMEEAFLDFLAEITPKRKFLTSFWRAVIRISESKFKTANQEYLQYKRRLESLQQYKDSLIEKNAKGILPDEDFKEALAKAKIEFEMTELAMNQAKTDIFKEEAAMDYSKQFIFNLPRQWFDLDIEGKRRFQKLLFPEGLPYLGNKIFGTAKLSVIFEINQQFQNKKSNLVGPVGFEPTTNRL